jgi:hypothetical protein
MPGTNRLEEALPRKHHKSISRYRKLFRDLRNSRPFAVSSMR